MEGLFKRMIGIIDYGMGNLSSILNMFKKVRVGAFVSPNPHELESASGLILPGVGGFDSAMKNLEKRELIHLLNQQIIE